MQQGGNTEKSPYLFTGKELDEETGLYYFGARYYDPKTSVWQSPDPILEKYLPQGSQTDLVAGGVFNSPNLGLYSYGHQRPLIAKDPDGNFVFITIAVVGAAITAYDTYQTYNEAGGGAEGLNAAGKALAVDGAITLATGGAGKLASKFVPNEVKDAVIEKVARAFKRKPCSFTAGTEVMTKEGLKPIESIKGGDIVLARDEQTGKNVWRKVIGTMSKMHDTVLVLKLQSEEGEQTQVITTGDHPFYVKGQGWTEAGQVKEGLLLETVEGFVRLTGATSVAKRQLAYDLTVAGAHTFFVGQAQVWVHNCGTDSTKRAKPSLSAHKEALKEVHGEVGKLPKGKPGKFGSPQAGDSKKGYRLDPAHDGVAKGDAESKPHINWWDYSEGKRGKGGRSGAVPIDDKD